MGLWHDDGPSEHGAGSVDLVWDSMLSTRQDGEAGLQALEGQPLWNSLGSCRRISQRIMLQVEGVTQT